eukprot:36637-Eustigmatos_ZCMA.PRE.1
MVRIQRTVQHLQQAGAQRVQPALGDLGGAAGGGFDLCTAALAPTHQKGPVRGRPRYQSEC